MRTKYDVGQEVFFFDPNKEEIVSEKAEMVFATEDGVFYKVDGVYLSEKHLYSCELQCRIHFIEIFL